MLSTTSMEFIKNEKTNNSNKYCLKDLNLVIKKVLADNYWTGPKRNCKVILKI